MSVVVRFGWVPDNQLSSSSLTFLSSMILMTSLACYSLTLQPLPNLARRATLLPLGSKFQTKVDNMGSVYRTLPRCAIGDIELGWNRLCNTRGNSNRCHTAIPKLEKNWYQGCRLLGRLSSETASWPPHCHSSKLSSSINDRTNCIEHMRLN